MRRIAIGGYRPQWPVDLRPDTLYCGSKEINLCPPAVVDKDGFDESRCLACRYQEMPPYFYLYRGPWVDWARERLGMTCA